MAPLLSAEEYIVAKGEKRKKHLFFIIIFYVLSSFYFNKIINIRIRISSFETYCKYSKLFDPISQDRDPGASSISDL
jgi:hypothetical protein